MPHRAVSLRYRLDVAARVLAATAGGYAIAALVAIAGAWTLPMTRADAVTAGTMAGIVAMPLAAMGCFWARSAWRAWAGIALAALLLGALAIGGGWRP